MRSALPIAVFAIAGCDLAFGLDGRVDPDAPLADASPDIPPGIDAPPSCETFTSTVTANADTMLMREPDGNCDPANRLGVYNNINLGQMQGGARSRLLLRFALTNDMLAALQPGGGFTEATLTLPLKPVACPGPCPSTAIDFSIHAAHSDWHEGQATGHIGTAWCARKQDGQGTITWQAQGANGANDRSMMSLGNVSVDMAQAAGDQLVVSTTPALPELENARMWILGGQLSLLLIPTSSNGILYVKAREDVVGGGGAQLTIKSCR